MNKKITVIMIIILVLVAIVASTRINKKDETITEFQNNIAKSNLVVKDITFSNIKKTYNEGITTINADVVNNTKRVKNANVQINVIDKNGNKVTSMIQILENLTPGKKQVLSTGIMGNYTDKMYEIEIKLISDKEIEAYNK